MCQIRAHTSVVAASLADINRHLSRWVSGSWIVQSFSRIRVVPDYGARLKSRHRGGGRLKAGQRDIVRPKQIRPERGRPATN